MEEEEINKYNESVYFLTKVENYILKDKNDDEKFKTFIKGEIGKVLELFEQIDSDENSSFFKHDPIYQYFIKLTNKITDEYIKSNFKEIIFILDPKNMGKLSIVTTRLFANSFSVFCRNIIKKFQEQEGKLEVD